MGGCSGHVWNSEIRNTRGSRMDPGIFLYGWCDETLHIRNSETLGPKQLISYIKVFHTMGYALIVSDNC